MRKPIRLNSTAIFRPLWRHGWFLLPLVFTTACIHHRELVNFDEGPAFETMVQELDRQNPIRLQPDDLISISVQTVDPVASAPFNLGGVAITGSSINTTMPGMNTAPTAAPTYLIDANGEINLPVLGSIKVTGWTTLEARDSIKRRLEAYLIAPIVNLRLINFKFTVLGEVNRAGSYTIGNERINILEALGMAGDLTNYGDREKVLIIRENAGKRSFGYINLHQRDVFRSPYFYLNQNDLVYVEPMKAKVGTTADAGTKYLQWALPIISVISIIISLTR